MWLVPDRSLRGRWLVRPWSGQKDQLEQLQAEEQKLKDEYKGKLQQAVNLEELRKQREQVSQYVLTLEKTAAQQVRNGRAAVGH